MSLKIVIVGAFGRLGSELASRYHGRFDLVTLGRNDLDLTDHKSIQDALGSLRFDLLFLPAALTNVDYCESHQEEAYQINGRAPEFIAKICREKQARMVHFSTDFVFDGKKSGPYSEEDIPRPISVYGASKLLGEEGVLGVSDANMVIRLSWLYGSAKPAFPEWIVDQASKSSDLSLPGEKIGSPTRCEDVVEMLDPLVFPSGTNSYKGLFHLCNSGMCSWQEWGQECIDLARATGVAIQANCVRPSKLESVKAFVAKRPVNSVMSTARYESFIGNKPRSWEVALANHFGVIRRGENVLCAS